MNRAIIFILLSLIVISCSKSININSNKILPILESGTDSTYKRKYFPNPNKSLYVIQASYCNAPIEVFVYYHDIDKKNVSEIKTYMIKKIYGHYFAFYHNGNLRQYCYYVGNGNNISYTREYTIDGKLEYEKGNPFVDYINDGKKNIELYFSTTFYDSLSVEISSSRNRVFQNLQLRKSSMQPMLLDCRLPITDSTLFLKIVAITNNPKETKIYNDTLNIEK